MELSGAELARYSRHLSLPEVGLEGQKKLKAARVLLIGSGGLGSPLALYLAAAGIGTLGIVDFDVVDATNLQRQVLHGTRNIGVPKTVSAKERLSDLNPFIQVETHETKLTSHNALGLLESYDIVVDGTDNFPTRYLVNDACVLLKKPNVYGSIFRFDGQISVFHPAGGGPCYRCLYPEPPPPHLVPSCAEGGVLGILPGVVGTLQATEVVKLVLGIGDSLRGVLLSFDALGMTFSRFRIRKNPECPLCGPEPSITELVDYQEFCGMNGESDTGAGAEEVSPSEFVRLWREGNRPLLVDVREPYEWEIANLEDYGARLCPLDLLLDQVSDWDREQEIVVHCKSGGRSARAQEKLVGLGFRRVKNLRGGILAWKSEVDDSLTAY